ncbi:ABC transporter transmembrane domain-containing protein, partial [Rhizobium leguminosarum]|uniref:ABC transporter transmembrane domain-containing protein n=1 Tax=Rhizobium leguminosarum TaxID=384 RepID=UPI003F9B6E1B
GHLITHVTKDLEEVGEVSHHGPEDLFIAIITFIGAFILMFTVHWKLALLTTAIVPFMTWLVSLYGAKMTRMPPTLSCTRVLNSPTCRN